MDKSTHEEHLFQLLKPNKKQLKRAVTFLSAYNGIFNVTNLNTKLYSKKAFINRDFIQVTIRPGDYEIESLDNEIERVIVDEGHYTEATYQFKIKPNFFSTRGSIVEIIPQGPINGFVFGDIIGNFLGFNGTIIWQENNLSHNPVDIFSFDKTFIDCDIAKGRFFKGKLSGTFHNFTMDVDLGYRDLGKIRGGVQWYMMESKDIISCINFKIENENGNLVYFNCQSITFRLSINEF